MKLLFCQNQFIKSKSRCQSFMICRQCLYYEFLNSNISADFKLCNLLYWKILKAKQPKSELLPKSAWNQSNFSIKTPKERNLKFEKDKWILSFWLCCQILHSQWHYPEQKGCSHINFQSHEHITQFSHFFSFIDLMAHIILFCRKQA